LGESLGLERRREMTVIVDDSPGFKALRARFYRLGKVKQGWILERMGYTADLSRMDNAAKKDLLIRIMLDGRLDELAILISFKEKEKEKAKEEAAKRLWDGFQANNRNPEEEERQDVATQQDGDTDAGV
jgi:hypothetical protein